MRTLIVHYHIFKNAGCSIDSILKDALWDRWASLDGPNPTSVMGPGDLSAFVSEHPTLVAVSSHLLRPPAPMDIRVLPVVLIRHPLDRAFSVYSQLRRNPADGMQSETVAKQASFSRFVLWCLENKPLGGVVIADYQVIHLSQASFRNGHVYEAHATEGDLQEAIDYLSSGACFGTVDRFDTAMGRLRLAAGKLGLRIAPPTATIKNRTDGRPENLQERLSIARGELGPELHARFLRANALDYDLYEWASRQHEDADPRKVEASELTGEGSLTPLAARD